jgi:hypothetical protein
VIGVDVVDEMLEASKQNFKIAEQKTTGSKWICELKKEML